MIKLPDFSRCVEIQDLLISMGAKQIEELPIVKFTREVKKTVLVKEKNTEQLNYAHRLHVSPVPLGRGENFAKNNDMIEINGLKACIYIKDQRDSYSYDTSPTYKYHLCWCKTIDEMVNKGRKSRYVATTRDDGFFLVNRQFSSGGHQEETIELGLCKNCQQLLEQKNMYFSPFTLREFYERYQTHIADSFIREETRISEEQYSPNQAEIASKYKKVANYTCAKCGVVCRQNENLLHLHHKDGNGQNNKHNNLIVLCIDCHAREFKHSHMRNNPAFEELMEKISKLRNEQGITVLNI